MMAYIRCIVFIFCTTTLTTANSETVRRSTVTLLGGWRHHKYPSESPKFIRLAYQAFSSLLDQPSLHGINLRVSKASTQVVAGLKYRLEVEMAKVSCGFQHPQQYGMWNHANNLVCFTGKVVRVCDIDFFHEIRAATPNVTSLTCREPRFEE